VKSYAQEDAMKQEKSIGDILHKNNQTVQAFNNGIITMLPKGLQGLVKRKKMTRKEALAIYNETKYGEPFRYGGDRKRKGGKTLKRTKM
jgi:hypothetical protein